MALPYNTPKFPSSIEEEVTINPEAEIELPVKTVPVGGVEGFGRGLKAGAAQMGQMASGLTMLAGDTLGIDWLEEKGRQGYKHFGRESEINRPRIAGIEEVEGVGDAADLIFNTYIAPNILNIAASLVGGGATGFVFKKFAENTARGMAFDLIEKKGAEQALKFVQNKANLGKWLGSYFTETGMMTGSIAGELDEAGAESLGAAIPAGAAAGAIGAYSDVKLLEKIAPGLFGKEFKKGVKAAAGRVAGQAALGGGTEAAQALVEKTPVTFYDPTKGLGSPTLGLEVLNEGLGGLFLEGPIAAAAEVPRLLNPSKNPLENQTAEDVLSKAKAVAKSDAQKEADKLLQEAAQGGTTEPTSTEPEGESLSANDFAAAWPDSFSTLTSLYEKEVGRKATDDEKELLFQAAEAGIRLNEVETELDRNLMDGKDSPDLQEERKQLRERINSIQAELQNVPKDKPTRQKDATKEAPYIQKIGADREGAKQYKEVKKRQAKPEVGKGKETKAIEKAIDKAYAKVQRLVGGIKAKVMSSEAMENDPEAYSKVKGFGPNMRGINMAVGFDDEGNLYLAVPSPERVREFIGNDKDELQTWLDVLEKSMEEEGVHLAVFEQWKRQWNKGGKKGTFTDFVIAKSQLLDQAFRNSLSDSTLQAFVASYGLDPQGTMPPETRANELIRAVIQKMRTGQMTEDLKVLSFQKNQGNKLAAELMDKLLAMVRQVRDAIMGVLNPDTMRGEIKEVADAANEILDTWEFEEGTPAPPAPATPAPAPTTLAAQQNAPQANVTQKKGQSSPPAERTVGDAIRDKDTFVFEGMRGALRLDDGDVVFVPFGTGDKYTIRLGQSDNLSGVENIEGLSWARKGQTRQIPTQPTAPETTSIIESVTEVTEQDLAEPDDIEVPQSLIEIESSPILNRMADLFSTGESLVSRGDKRRARASTTPEFYQLVSPDEVATANTLIDTALNIIDNLPISESQKDALAEPFLLLDQDISTYENHPKRRKYKASILNEVRPSEQAVPIQETQGQTQVPQTVTPNDTRTSPTGTPTDQESTGGLRDDAGRTGTVPPTERTAPVYRAETRAIEVPANYGDYARAIALVRSVTAKMPGFSPHSAYGDINISGVKKADGTVLYGNDAINAVPEAARAELRELMDIAPRAVAVQSDIRSKNQYALFDPVKHPIDVSKIENPTEILLTDPNGPKEENNQQTFPGLIDHRGNAMGGTFTTADGQKVFVVYELQGNINFRNNDTYSQLIQEAKSEADRRGQPLAIIDAAGAMAVNPTSPKKVLAPMYREGGKIDILASQMFGNPTKQNFGNFQARVYPERQSIVSRAGATTPPITYSQNVDVVAKDDTSYNTNVQGTKEQIAREIERLRRNNRRVIKNGEPSIVGDKASGFAYQPDMLDPEKADFRTWAGATTPADRYRQAEDTVSQGIASLLDYASSNLKSVPETVSSKMATYFGDFFRGAFHDKKLQRTTVMAAANFIKENGFISAARRLASGTTGLNPEEDIVLAGAIIQTSNAYMDDMKDFAGDWKDVSVTAKTQAMGEVVELANKARDILSAMAKSGGRQVNILGWMKKTLFDGGAASNDVSNMIYAAMNRLEPGINRETLGGLVSELREIFGNIADRVFSDNEMFNFLQHTANKLLQDPMALKRRLRESLKVAAAEKVGKNVGARAGEFELQTDDGIRKMFDTIAGHLLGLEPEGKSNKEASAKRLLRSALQTMAEQFMPEVKEVQEAAEGSPRALKTLATLIANDNLRQQFIDVLENQAAAQFAKGKADPSFKANYAAAFKSMREGDYLADLRRDAAASMARAIKGSVASMMPTWSESKAEAMAMLDKVNAGLSPETREFLYNEINKELDRLAEAHLEKTWGFARKEDGTLDLTKKGSLKGGTELKAFLKNMGTSLTDLTKLTYASREAKFDALAEGMVTQLGLPLEMALGVQSIFQKNLKDAVEWQQDKNIKRRVEQLQSTLSDKNKAKQLTPTGFIDKVVELASQGYLDDKVVYEAITKSYHRKNMPEFSAAMGAKIRELANGMEGMPEGYEKDQIRQVIANEIQNMIPMNFGDAAISYWYFSLLSGFSTWGVVNPISNFANLMGTMTSLAATNPGKTGKILATFYKSVMSKDSAAWSRFKYTMETGFTPVAIGPKLFLSQGEKIGEGMSNQVIELANLPVERINKEMTQSKAGSLLDRIGRKFLYGISRGIKLGKIELSARSLTRFMSATDQFFRVAGTDVGLSVYSQTDFDALYKAAQPMAAAEGKRGNDLLMRAREIAFQQLAEKGEAEGYAIQNAEKVGFESAFTQVPKGAVGQLARMLGSLANTYPPFRILFPFTNIVANVWNESLNYVAPFGVYRYIDKKGWGIYNDKGELVKDPTLLAKSVMGLLAFAIMAMLDGDDEDYFEITGQGPRDRMDRVAFFERGMKPFSFRAGDMIFSYQYLGPLSQPLGIVGTMLDLVRDRRQADDPAEEKLFAVVSSLFTNQMSQSFLSSASSLFEAIYSTDPGGKLQKWTAFQFGSVVPNIAKQINNDFIDNDYYRSSDFKGQVLNAWSVTKKIGNEPALSYYGEQRENKRWPVIGRIVSDAGGDRTIADLSALNLRLPGFTEQINGVDMTDQQKTQFRRIAGPQLKAAHDRMLPRLRQLVAAGRTQEAQDLLDETSADINRQARRQILLDAMRSR